MSSNRLIYDTCYCKKNLQESTDPLKYNLYKGKYELNKKCPNSDHTNVLKFGTRTEVESELHGLNYRASLCPTHKYDRSKFKMVPFSPPRMCEGIHHITPSNLKRGTTKNFLC